MARGDIDTELEVGDVVTILGRVDRENDQEFGMAWVEDEMDEAIGRTGEVTQYGTYDGGDTERRMYKVSGCTNWWWIAEWLDVHVNQEFDDEAFESVFK